MLEGIIFQKRGPFVVPDALSGTFGTRDAIAELDERVRRPEEVFVLLAVLLRHDGSLRQLRRALLHRAALLLERADLGLRAL